MSLKFPRLERPPPGETLLLSLGTNQPWKDPTKPENNLPPLESEKGMFVPTWPTLIGLSGFYFAVRYLERFKIRLLL